MTPRRPIGDREDSVQETPPPSSALLLAVWESNTYTAGGGVNFKSMSSSPMRFVDVGIKINFVLQKSS